MGQREQQGPSCWSRPADRALIVANIVGKMPLPEGIAARGATGLNRAGPARVL